jgi:hypothetical protein
MLAAFCAAAGFGQAPAAPPPHEYRVAGNSDDVVRVFYVTHAQTPQDLQEIATLIRTTADVKRLFIYNARKALALRGTAEQMKVAEWLIEELDQARGQAAAAPGAKPGGPEYRVPGNSDDVVRVFYLTHTQTPQDLQEVATLVRSTVDIKRLYVYNAPKALAVRASANQVATAEWLVRELDQANR